MTVPAKTPPRDVSKTSSKQSATGRQEFARAMATLCALKRTAELSTTTLTAWHAVLQRFRPTTLNWAVLQLAASQTRFPELSDVLQECRRIEPPQRPYNPHGEAPKSERLTDAELREIAGRIGLEV